MSRIDFACLFTTSYGLLCPRRFILSAHCICTSLSLTVNMYFHTFGNPAFMRSRLWLTQCPGSTLHACSPLPWRARAKLHATGISGYHTTNNYNMNRTSHGFFTVYVTPLVVHNPVGGLTLPIMHLRLWLSSLSDRLCILANLFHGLPGPGYMLLVYPAGIYQGIVT